MDEKRYQVFVSSTSKDLQEERQAAINALLKNYCIPAGMEFFGGTGDSIEIIKKRIRESDILLLIVGGKYGSIYKSDGNDIGFTEFEYDYALSTNKPIAVIKLSDSMLHMKAAKYGDDNVYEQKYKTKYKKFVRKIKTKWIISISNCGEITGAIGTHISNIERECYDKMIGWKRCDSFDMNFSCVAENDLKKIFNNSLDAYMNNYYGKQMHEISESVGTNLLKALKADGILDLFDRDLEIKSYKSNLIKVILCDTYRYSYLNSEHRKFGKRFHSTKQQAETYHIDKLIINHIDYTSQFELKIYEEPDRGQLNYCVESVKSIPMGNGGPIEVYIKSSYICSPEEFFQAFNLPFPCRYFKVSIVLDEKINELYSVVTSTSSPFSISYADSYKAYEMKNFGKCILTFNDWSLAGTGYAATLKKKSFELNN